MSAEGPRAVSMNRRDVAIAISRPAAIIWGHIGPIVSRYLVGRDFRLRIIDAIVHLSRAVDMEAAAFRDLIEAFADDALLAINHVQAPALVIPGWQSTRALRANRSRKDNQ